MTFSEINNYEIQQPEKTEDLTGKFFEFVFSQLGRGDDAEPFILYSSTPLYIMEAKENIPVSESGPGDLDMLTTEEGLRRLEVLLFEYKEELNVKDYEVLIGNQHKSYLNTPEIPQLKCKIEIAGETIELDVWANIKDSGTVKGVEDTIDLRKDVVNLPINYVDESGNAKTIEVPTLSAEAQVKAYKQLIMGQSEFENQQTETLTKLKDRTSSIKRTFAVNAVTLDNEKITSLL